MLLITSNSGLAVALSVEIDQRGDVRDGLIHHQPTFDGEVDCSFRGLPVTVYAHVARDEMGRVTLQHWALYFYNDWFNKHEGDWEMVQVMLGADDQPDGWHG